MAVSIDAVAAQREIDAANEGADPFAEVQDWHPRMRSPSSENYTSWAGTHPSVMAVEDATSFDPSASVMGSGPSFSEFEAQYSGSQQPGMIDPTFSGSNAIIDVDTFEDIRAAARRSASDTTVSANPAISKSLQVDDFSNIRAAFARTMGNVETGSVNLAPIGINVGYQSNIGKIDSFDQLDASTKAAVKAAGIQSQSEDETENAIAQIFGAFQSILNKASKNTTNRQMGGSGSMGPDQ